MSSKRSGPTTTEAIRRMAGRLFGAKRRYQQAVPRFAVQTYPKDADAAPSSQAYSSQRSATLTCNAI